MRISTRIALLLVCLAVPLIQANAQSAGTAIYATIDSYQIPEGFEWPTMRPYYSADIRNGGEEISISKSANFKLDWIYIDGSTRTPMEIEGFADIRGFASAKPGTVRALSAGTTKKASSSVLAQASFEDKITISATGSSGRVGYMRSRFRADYSRLNPIAADDNVVYEQITYRLESTYFGLAGIYQVVQYSDHFYHRNGSVKYDRNIIPTNPEASVWTMTPGDRKSFTESRTPMTDDYIVNIPFIFGEPFDLGLGLETIGGSECCLAGGKTGRDIGEYSVVADHSMNWGGILDVYDQNGVALSGYSVASASGFDYTRSLIPVPEPSVWILTLCGLVAVPRVFAQRRNDKRDLQGGVSA